MNKNLTPEQSLGIISKSILSAKIQNDESGSIFIFWGLLIMLASIGQFILLQTQFYNISYYPYFLFPLGAVYTWIMYSRKSKLKGKQKLISFQIPLIWIVIGGNFMVLSIGYDFFLSQLLTPVILILLGIGSILTGSLMRSGLILIGGLLTNIIGILCFFIEWEYHSLMLCFAAFSCLTIPGLYMKLSLKKQND